MHKYYYYQDSLEYEQERNLLNRFSIREIRYFIREFGWDFVSGTTNISIPMLYRLVNNDYQAIPKVAMMDHELYSRIIKLNQGYDPYWVRRESISFLPEELDDVESSFLSIKSGKINFAYLYSDHKRNAESFPQSVTVYSLALSDFDPTGPYKQVSDWKTNAYAPFTAVDWAIERASFDQVINLGR